MSEFGPIDWNGVEPDKVPEFPLKEITALTDKCHRLEARIAELEAAHKANIAQIRKYRRGKDGHHCEWRVIAEAIEARSSAMLARARR